MATTTGAFSRRAGKTTHARTLSSPARIVTHSPLRGEAASLAFASVPLAGRACCWSTAAFLRTAPVTASTTNTAASDRLKLVMSVVVGREDPAPSRRDRLCRDPHRIVAREHGAAA